ncbi:hypothetical protein KAR91_23680 [Candidatus Pacearchaeota archaeon]|nr:hypothetical protein [Candidatus Pacearchaeota archaeon]
MTFEIESVSDAIEARKVIAVMAGIEPADSNAKLQEEIDEMMSGQGKPAMSERKSPVTTQTADPKDANVAAQAPKNSLLGDVEEQTADQMTPAQVKAKHRADVKAQLDALDPPVEYNGSAGTSALEKKLAKIVEERANASDTAGADTDPLLDDSPTGTDSESLLGEVSTPSESQEGSLLDEEPVDTNEADKARVELRKLVALIGKDGARATLMLTTKCAKITEVLASGNDFGPFFATVTDIQEKVANMVEEQTHTQDQAVKVINIKLGIKT